MAERVVAGVGVTPLVGVGTVVHYDPTADLTLGEPEPTADAEAELERFETAHNTARAELESERARTAERVGEEEAEIFDAHVQFLEDPQVTERVERAVREDGLSAEHAVSQAFDEAIDQVEAAGGMFAERTDDLRDVRDRLLRILLDRDRDSLEDLPDGTVVVAERLTPSDTAQLDPESIAGFATVEGGETSHAAIMARSLAIPAVVGAGNELTDVPDGVRVVVDGREGTVVVDPASERVEAARAGHEVDVRHEPVSTADGVAVEVAANVGTSQEVDLATAQGADGIGLFRTEFLFLERESPPSEEEQYETIREACAAFDGGRVVVRTLDVGGDKPVPYIDTAPGNNPFLGVRGVRLAPGERPDLFETQVRAVLRAAAHAEGADPALMFPLVSTVEELDDLLARVEDVAAALDDEGIDYARPELGVMIETPASTFLAREFAKRLDFLSIGTNDLTQYVMAAARDDDRLADLHDPLHPSVLRAIDRAVEAGHAGNAWVGMCGEMAGNPELTELLVGLGLDELSMSAVTVPQVKANVEATTQEEAEELAARALAEATREGVLELVNERRWEPDG